MRLGWGLKYYIHSLHHAKIVIYLKQSINFSNIFQHNEGSVEI